MEWCVRKSDLFHGFWHLNVHWVVLKTDSQLWVHLWLSQGCCTWNRANFPRPRCTRTSRRNAPPPAGSEGCPGPADKGKENRCHLEGSICCPKISTHFSALMLPSQCKWPSPRALRQPSTFGVVADNSSDSPFCLEHVVPISSSKTSRILIWLSTEQVSFVMVYIWWLWGTEMPLLDTVNILHSYILSGICDCSFST